MMNGTQAPPPGVQTPVQINIGVQNNVSRLNVICGCTNMMVDLPVHLARQVATKWLSELDKAEKALIVVPGSALPPGAKS